VVFRQRGPLTGLRFILAEPETWCYANAAFFEVKLDKLPAGNFISSQVYRTWPEGLTESGQQWHTSQPICQLTNPLPRYPAAHAKAGRFQ